MWHTSTNGNQSLNEFHFYISCMSVFNQPIDTGVQLFPQISSFSLVIHDTGDSWYMIMKGLLAFNVPFIHASNELLCSLDSDTSRAWMKVLSSWLFAQVSLQSILAKTVVNNLLTRWCIPMLVYLREITSAFLFSCSHWSYICCFQQ